MKASQSLKSCCKGILEQLKKSLATALQQIFRQGTNQILPDTQFLWQYLNLEGFKLQIMQT
jgi:hypothetical protein